MDGIEEDPTEIQHFSLGSTSPGGGITKVKGGGLIKTEGKGGSILYLAVNDLEETMKVTCDPCRANNAHRTTAHHCWWRQTDE